MSGVFELYGCLTVQRGVPAPPVVEALDVLEDGVRDLEACPALPIEQLGLHVAPERFEDGVVVRIADASSEGSRPALRARSVNFHEVNWVPWSRWMIAGGQRAGVDGHAQGALVARSARWDESMAGLQPGVTTHPGPRSRTPCLRGWDAR